MIRYPTGVFFNLDTVFGHAPRFLKRCAQDPPILHELNDFRQFQSSESPHLLTIERHGRAASQVKELASHLLPNGTGANRARFCCGICSLPGLNKASLWQCALALSVVTTRVSEDALCLRRAKGPAVTFYRGVKIQGLVGSPRYTAVAQNALRTYWCERAHWSWL